MDRYLELLRRCGVRGTFFVVGEVARRYPDILRAVAADGHELGCHGDRHLALDQLTPETFSTDLRANRAAVEAATGHEVVGFRAPVLSLTEQTSWVYDVLAAEGFEYSSSVLPASNPLYGWPDFGNAPRRMEGFVEIPISLASPFGVGMPLFSGTYFRVMPWLLVSRQMRSLPSQYPLVCYFHPYDIDHRQPWAMHTAVRGSHLLNTLLFLRRRSLLKRLGHLLRGAAAMTYRDFAASV